MTISSSHKLYVLSLIFVLLSLVLVSAAMNKTREDLEIAESNYAISADIAEEVRHDREHMTDFARLYAATGNGIFRKYYQDIVNMENGEAPRPEIMTPSYWAYVVGEKMTHDPQGKTESLADRLLRIGATSYEKALIREARRRSVNLNNMDEAAFAAMEGRFLDSLGTYTATGAPDPKLAVTILHGEKYAREFSNTMVPIDTFIGAVTKRTRGLVESTRNRIKTLIIVQYTLAIFGTAGAIALLIYMSKTIVAPLTALATQAKRIANGDYGDRNTINSTNEIGVLANTINDMASSVMKDIEHIQKEERTIRDQKQLIENILDGIHAAYVVTSCNDMAIVDYNKTALQILQVNPEDIANKHASDIINFKLSNSDTAEIRCAFHANEFEGALVQQGGQSIPATMSIVPFSYYDEKRVAVVLFDISRRKALELQLGLAQRLESIGNLATGIAHEINTPIQYVGDNLNFLKETFSELLTAIRNAGIEDQLTRTGLDMVFIAREVPQALTQSSEGVDHVAKIVRAMKRFAHVRGEEKSLIDVAKAVDNVVLISRNEWKYSSEIMLDIDPAANELYCVPGEFNQVLLNLVTNASHAVADKFKDRVDKGLITIKAYRDGDWIAISVADTGCGIPEENLGKVFDPFFTTKEVGKGTGQGLALTHDIVVNKHNGSIELQSRPGEGTTFIIRFPHSVKQKENSSL